MHLASVWEEVATPPRRRSPRSARVSRARRPEGGWAGAAGRPGHHRLTQLLRGAGVRGGGVWRGGCQRANAALLTLWGALHARTRRLTALRRSSRRPAKSRASEGERRAWRPGSLSVPVGACGLYTMGVTQRCARPPPHAPQGGHVPGRLHPRPGRARGGPWRGGAGHLHAVAPRAGAARWARARAATRGRKASRCAATVFPPGPPAERAVRVRCGAPLLAARAGGAGAARGGGGGAVGRAAGHGLPPRAYHGRAVVSALALA